MIINEGRPGKKLPTLTNPGVAGDLLSGKQLIGQDGNIITGTIPSKASTDISVSGRTVTVPAGYYPSQASKSIASATQATPSITVSSGGLITASATQSAGYVASGTKSATKQLTTQAGKTVTPGTSNQTAVASGRYTTGTVYVAGDSDLIAPNIKSGVNIFGVTGTYEGKSVIEVSASDVTSVTRNSANKITINHSVSIPTDYDLMMLYFWIQDAQDDEIQNVLAYLTNMSTNMFYAGWVGYTYRNYIYSNAFARFHAITFSGSSITVDLTDYIDRLDNVSFPSSPINMFTLKALYYPCPGWWS